MIKKSVAIFNNYICTNLNTKTIKKVDNLSDYLFINKIKIAIILNLNDKYLDYFKKEGWDFERKTRKDGITIINYNIIKNDHKVYLSNCTNYLIFEIDNKNSDKNNLKLFLIEREKLKIILDKIGNKLGYKKSHIQPTLSATIFKLSQKFIIHNYGKVFFNKLFTRKPFNLKADDFIYLLQNSRGSYVHFQKKYKNKKLDNIYSYDLNSAFPFFLSEKIPFGPATKNKFKDLNYATFLVIDIFKYEAIKKTCPIIYDRNYFKNKLKGDISTFLGVWDEELRYIKKFYNLDYKVIHKMHFTLKNNIFKKFVKEFYKYKYVNKNIKLMLNCLVGKFFQSTFIRETFNNKLSNFEDKKDFINNLNYSPYPIQIPSFIYMKTRIKLFKLVNENINSWVRSHTDSAIFIKPIKNTLNNKKIGEWRCDKIGYNAKFKNVNNFYYFNKENKKVVKGREQEWIEN